MPDKLFQTITSADWKREIARSRSEPNLVKLKIMEQSYTTFVSGLLKPGETILKEMAPSQANLAHLAMGVSGEAGELLDTVKKHVIYQKPLDRENMIEELGDLEFFMQALRTAIGVSRDEVIARNIAKLEKRYPKGSYSNAQAINRADK
jgi:NTP pyrophosphatase (non-canonical NTP hydrolase)